MAGSFDNTDVHSTPSTFSFPVDMAYQPRKINPTNLTTKELEIEPRSDGKSIINMLLLSYI